MKMTINSDCVDSKKNRIDFLDGIRGWASFSVLLSHTIVCFLALSTPQLQFTKERLKNSLIENNFIDFIFFKIMKIISNGYLAVLVFFVLSGYVLSVTHLNKTRSDLALASVSRYFRLMIPIFVTSFIAYILLKFGLFFNLEAASSPESSSGWLGTFYRFDASLKDLFIFSLYGVFFNYNPETTYNSSLWTMSVEMLGSILIYAYLGIFRSKEKTYWLLISLVIFILALLKSLYVCFFAGYLIAELNLKYQDAFEGGKIMKIASLIFFIIILMISVNFKSNSGASIFVAIFLVLTASFSIHLKSFFANKSSQFLGRISFPLYLIQIPVICSWSSYLYIQLPLLGLSHIQSNFVNLFSTICICFLASILLLPIEKIGVACSKKIGKLILQ
jgi:peptidoglycan/LPS O-acetylase OafA/YrhL